MAAGIAQVGERELSGTFGWDNNEIHRKIYVQDFSQIETVLSKLTDDGSDATHWQPHRFPVPFDSFYVHSVSFNPVHPKSTQGSGEVFALDFLDALPKIQGGVVIDITYRPYDNDYHAAEEVMDYSAQVMSIMSNAISQLTDATGATNCATWITGGQVTNLQGMVKVIPKIDVMQRKIFLKSAPTDDMLSKIGKINDNALTIIANGQNTRTTWPAGTVMLSGMPTIRRWRWDGNAAFETAIKLSIMTYKGKVESTTTDDYVTWNRLYRVNKGWWERVIMPHTNDPLYIPADLSFLNDM